MARVVMAYTFADVDSGEEIIAKVAGQGLDPGDKAPYKAMTGALKYALLQSFLLATGDDPEDERVDARSAATNPERLISGDEVRELQEPHRRNRNRARTGTRLLQGRLARGDDRDRLSARGRIAQPQTGQTRSIRRQFMPRIERLHQNTPEWHRWRRQGIGASDAPVIMGETAFKTPRTLWSIKTGRMQEGSAGPAARRGRELERFARRAYERQTGIQMEPLCLVHEEFEWMRASLDGLSFDGSTLLEIKCPLSLRDRASAQEGRIPSQYHAQLQHQLEVSGAERAHYWSFHGTDGILVEIRPDREYAKRLVEAEAAFWQLVKENRWPELANEELDLSADPKWRHAALRYREVRLRLENATSEEHKLRAMLACMATARRTYGCGVEVLKSSRKGAVDYSAVPELRGVNLEPYRKPPVAVVKINFIEPNQQ